ncbi:nuclear transport factor 2 family protein [Bradyrhizobium oligotrophicum]|uniref:nuclear transport factor 2 family protein n=1 Tax=Bradyrhizobium oligotrophicum TaxID=44255 RepID=UPI003EBDFFEA
MHFDLLARAIDWLDAYRSLSHDVVTMYADDATIFCGCGSEKALTGRMRVQSYWIKRFDEKPAGELVDIDDLGGNVVAVTYRTQADVVRAVLGFDPSTGLITVQRCGPV